MISLLHVRGGVSDRRASWIVFAMSSPRPWRCFRATIVRNRFAQVFSTSVEVFPEMFPETWLSTGLLHVRGGVSLINLRCLDGAQSSPRPWRCFHESATAQLSIKVFSTSVEVFLECVENGAEDHGLLHVRGGVSETGGAFYGMDESSPRPWRCFHLRGRLTAQAKVFSTSVEVFLWLCASTTIRNSLLHVRGGVSCVNRIFEEVAASSPRPWRCFHLSRLLPIQAKVFSTSVEVFLTASCPASPAMRLLHVRGGVSHPTEARTKE